MLIRTLRALALCAAVSTLGACAFTSEDVDIQYRPASAPPVISAAQGIVVKVTSVDARQAALQGKVGSKKNGLGMETAPIRARQNIPLLVRDAVSQELTGRGFVIGLDNATIAIEVVHFYADFKIGMWAAENVGEIILEVTVKDAGGAELFKKTVKSEGSVDNVVLALGEHVQNSLQLALIRVISALVDDPDFINALIRTGARPVTS